MVFKPSKQDLKLLNPSATVPPEWKSYESAVDPVSHSVGDSVGDCLPTAPLSTCDVTVPEQHGGTHTYFDAQNNTGTGDLGSVLCEDVYVDIGEDCTADVDTFNHVYHDV